MSQIPSGIGRPIQENTLQEREGSESASPLFQGKSISPLQEPNLPALKSLLGPLVSPLLRDASGSLDLSKIPAKDFQEFKKFLIDQVKIDGIAFNQHLLASYHKVLSKSKYEPLLRMLWEPVGAALRGRPQMEEGSHMGLLLLQQFTAEIISVSSDKFVSSHFSSKEGRHLIRHILGDSGHYTKEIRTDVVKAVATMGEGAGDWLHAFQIDRQISSWNYFNVDVTDQELNSGIHHAAVILKDVDEFEADSQSIFSRYFKAPQKVSILKDDHLEGEITPQEIHSMAQLYEVKKNRTDPLSEMEAKLARFWLLAIDNANWLLSDEHYVSNAQRAFLANKAEAFLNRVKAVTNEKEFVQLNSELNDFLHGPVKSDGDSLIDWVEHKVVGNGIDQFFSDRPTAYRSPFDELKRFSEEISYAVEMGERIRIRDNRPRTPDTGPDIEFQKPNKEYVEANLVFAPKDVGAIHELPLQEDSIETAQSHFISGLEKTKRQLWYQYKTHKTLSRAISNVAENPWLITGLPGLLVSGQFGDKVEIKKATAEIDRMIERLEQAETKQDVQKEIDHLYAIIEKDQVLYNAMEAAEMELIEQMIGLGQSVAIYLGIAVATGGMAAPGLAANALRAGNALRLMAFGAKTETAAMALHGMRAGFMGTMAENSLALASDEVGSQDGTVLSWGKDGVSTALAMGVFTPFAARLGKGIEKNIFSRLFTRYTQTPRQGVGRLAGDSALEGTEELFDANVRQAMEGNFRGLTPDQIREISLVSFAGGGAKIGTVAEGFRGFHLANRTSDVTPIRHPFRNPILAIAPMFLGMGLSGIGGPSRKKSKKSPQANNADPPLKWHDQEKEQTLIKRIRESNFTDREAINELFKAFNGLIWHIARRYKEKPDQRMDLVHEGYLGLMEAVRRTNLKGGFFSYAGLYIRSFMLDFIASNSGIAQMAPDTYWKHRQGKTYQLDAVPHTIQERLLHNRSLQPGKMSLEEEVYQRELIHILSGSLEVFERSLNPRDRVIFEQRILPRLADEEPILDEEIGRQFDVTPRRIRRLEDKLLNRLTQHLYDHGLGDFLDSYFNSLRRKAKKKGGDDPGPGSGGAGPMALIAAGGTGLAAFFGAGNLLADNGILHGSPDVTSALMVAGAAAVTALGAWAFKKGKIQPMMDGAREIAVRTAMLLMTGIPAEGGNDLHLQDGKLSGSQKQKLEEIYKKYPELQTALEKTGWGEDVIDRLIDQIEKKPEGAKEATYKILPIVLDGLEGKDWTEEQKSKFVSLLAEKTGKYPGRTYVTLKGLSYDFLMALLEQAPSHIVSSHCRLDLIYKGMEALGWSDEQKISVLRALAEKKFKYNVAYFAYLDLPTALEGMRGLGWNYSQESELLISIAKKSIGDPSRTYRSLPLGLQVVRSLGGGQEQQAQLLLTLVEKAEKDDWDPSPSYQNLSSLSGKMDERFWNDEKKYHFVNSLISRGGKDWREALRFAGQILNFTSPEPGLKVGEGILRLFSNLTDYNRTYVLGLFNSNAAWLDKLGSKNFPAHFEFYVTLFEHWPRWGLRLLDGVLEATKKGLIPPELSPSEQERILHFIRQTNGFIPAFYQAYLQEAEALFPKLKRYSQAMYRDELGLKEIEQIVHEHGEESLLALIQMISPLSGRTFARNSDQWQFFQEVLKEGDLRENIPLPWRKKTENIPVHQIEWRWKEGESQDPEGRIREILQGFSWVEGSHAVTEQNLIKAIEDYLQSDRSSPSLKVLRLVLYQFERQQNPLIENFERLQGGDFLSLRFLEEIFADAEGLSRTLGGAFEKVSGEYKKGKGIGKPINNLPGMVSRLQAEWDRKIKGESRSVAERLKVLGSILAPMDPSQIEATLLDHPGLSEELREAIRQLPRLRTELSSKHFVAKILEEPLGSIRSEIEKYESKVIRESSLELRVVRGPAFGLWAWTVGVCTAKDLGVWRSPKFHLFAMFDPELEQAVGYVQAIETEIDGKKVLTLPGINPTIEFSSQTDSASLYQGLIKALVSFAKAGGYDALYIPTSKSIHSNRGEYQQEIKRAKYPKRKIPELHWNTIAPFYPFSDVYVVWERKKFQENQKIEEFFQLSPEDFQIMKDLGTQMGNTDLARGARKDAMLGYVRRIRQLPPEHPEYFTGIQELKKLFPIADWFSDIGDLAISCYATLAAQLPAGHPEFLEGVNHLRSLQQREIKESTHKVLAEALGRLEPLEDSGWSREESVTVLDSIAKQSKRDLTARLQQFAQTLRGLKALDWPPKYQFKLLSRITPLGLFKGGFEYTDLLKPLPTLQEQKWSFEDQIELLVRVVEKSANPRAACSGLSSALQAVGETKWSIQQKTDLLVAIAEKSRGYVEVAYSNLRDGIRRFKEEGLDENQIYQFLRKAIENGGPHTPHSFHWYAKFIQNSKGSKLSGPEKFDLLLRLAPRALEIESNFQIFHGKLEELKNAGFSYDELIERLPPLGHTIARPRKIEKIAEPSPQKEITSETVVSLRQALEDQATAPEILGQLGEIARDSEDDLIAHQALEALIEVGLESSLVSTSQRAALELGRLFQQRRHRPYFEKVWARLGLREITFQDGGDSQSLTSYFMRNHLDRRVSTESPLPIQDVPIHRQEIYLDEFLVSQGVLAEKERLGRSVLYSLPGSSKVLVIKYLTADKPGKEGENEKKLIRELQMLEMVKKIGPRSTFPDPIRDESGRVIFFHFEEGKKGIVFRAPADYYRYLDDPTLSDAEFLNGLKNAVYDSFLLARYGLFHTVPLALFHQPNANRFEEGRYIPSIDLLPSNGHGMGRLDNWPKAIRDGNMGVTGLRDLEEIATLEEILDPLGEYKFELSQMQGLPNIAALQEALILKKILLAPQLLIGHRLAIQAGDRWVGAWKDDAFLQKYADWLLEVFAVAYAARWKISEEDAVEVLGEQGSWIRMARQLAVFQTPAHAQIFKPGTPISEIPTELIFGKGVVLKGGTPEVVGPYRPETFHKTLGFLDHTGALSLGPVNGAYPITEFDKASWAVFLEPGKRVAEKKLEGVPEKIKAGEITSKKLFHLARAWERAYYPNFEEDGVTAQAHSSWYFFSPSWHIERELITPEVLQELYGGKKLLSVGAGNAYLEQFLARVLKVPIEQISLADIDTSLLPKDFRIYHLNMNRSWPNLEDNFDFIIFPESFVGVVYEDGLKKRPGSSLYNSIFRVISNAVSFLRPGGEIRINGHCLNEAQIEELRSQLADKLPEVEFSHPNRALIVLKNK